jgi:hypothetical protein
MVMSFARRCGVALAFVLTPCFAQAEELRSWLRFTNDSGATLEIVAVDGEEAQDLALQIVLPQQEVVFPVPSGHLVLDIVAFKAAPPRIHRMEITTQPGESAYYRFIPHLTGLYILEDAGGLGAPPPPGPGQPLVGQKSDAIAGGGVAVACRTPWNTRDGVVLWESEQQARYYNTGPGYLCGRDGADAFRVGAIHAHFICQANWSNCVRHEDGDLDVLASVRTSQIMDTARRLARCADPGASFTWTQPTVRRSDPALTGSMTTYVILGSSNLEPAEERDAGSSPESSAGIPAGCPE